MSPDTVCIWKDELLLVTFKVKSYRISLQAHLNSCSILGMGGLTESKAMLVALHCLASCNHCWHCDCKSGSSSITTTFLPQSRASLAFSMLFPCNLSLRDPQFYFIFPLLIAVQGLPHRHLLIQILLWQAARLVSSRKSIVQ